MRGNAFGDEYNKIDARLLKRLLKFLKPYYKYVFFAVILTILVSALGPLRPFLTKIAVDEFISKGDKPGLLMMIVAITSLLLVSGALRFALTYSMQWVGQNVLNDIRIKLFEHIQKLSMSFYDKNPVGKLVTRVTNDVEALNQLFSSGLVMMVADILLIFWIFVFMFYTSWQLALLAIIVVPLLLIVTTIFRKKVRVLFSELRREVARMNTFLNEFISGITTVKLFNQEKNQLNKFDEINLNTRELNIKTVFYYAIFYPAIEMISAISLGIILWYAAGNILSGVITVGILIAFLQYAEMFFRPIRDLSEKYTTLQSAMASAERIFQLFDTEEFVFEDENAVEITEFQQAIEFKNVSFSYDNSKWVLKNVSFEVKKGETVAIVGATGSGKTSLINLLCRFYEFQSGEVLIDGKDIRKIKTESLRKLYALVQQDVFLFSRTIAENISLNDDNLSHDELIQTTQALGASTFIENLEKGFHFKLTERGNTLSSGQKQLIQFSRAYISNPEILILDEATSNIDSETEQIIENSLEKLLNNRTSIIIAHRLSTIKRADKIIVLHKGEIREQGNHEQLLANNGIYAKLYNLQFKDTVSVSKSA